MTLPVVPGSSLSFSQVNTELGYSSTAQISLNDSAVRTLAGVGASPATISVSNLSGKSNTFSFTIASNQTNANLRSLAVAAGWGGTSQVIATINSGVYISSNSTGTPALRVDGSFPGGVRLNNNGAIIGMGGAGARGGNTVAATPAGSGGGGALSVAVAITINNAGTIGGGGGGGGGGNSEYENYDGKYGSGTNYYGGGGGGGGRSSVAANSAGGAGGVAANGTGNAGGAGTVSAAGGGGAVPGGTAGAGGAGGGWGASGAYGATANPYSGIYFVASSGGAGGYAVSGNGNITWTATGTRLGGIS
jgi:hypothetical protein